ncbi:MAG TPA: phosphoadenylyl-sulfate reductase [Bacteroidales bacterium]|nr:phosphoadenylyl-sulfate reductase [Bacteroidales bacterium]
MTGSSDLIKLSSQLESLSLVDRIRELASVYPGKIVFTSSFGIEDQVITDLIFRNSIPVEIITLDTGRLFPETYQVFSETLLKYRKNIRVLFPDNRDVEKLMSEKGPFSFYESKENRMECCHIRKVIPLDKGLEGKSIWLTGIRADQSVNRSSMSHLEYDVVKKIIKFHPLFDWTLQQVEQYIKEFHVPYNMLHNKGYLSIGCEPCTRPVLEGMDFRSGRWWWEADGTKECGCHVKYNEEKN